MSSGSIRSGVVGWPVAHSRSPLIHRHWLDKYAIAGSYDAFAVSPDGAEQFFGTFVQSGMKGCNVTVPHKETAFAALDVAHEAARRLGAANTLWVENGKLNGDNTDLYGFLANLDEQAPGWADDPARPAIVLGAGGAARAVVAGLLDKGFQSIRLVNRRPARAETLLRDLGAAGTVFAWSDMPRAFADAILLINTTPLGMDGHEHDGLDLSTLPGDAMISDIVYVPLITPLLAAARARGNRIVDGLGMLLHQAVPGFEYWFGRRPCVTPHLRALVIADMEAR